MKNLKEVFERYESQKGFHCSILVLLNLVSKSFYEINSDKQISLNSNYSGLILNPEGRAQCYGGRNNYEIIKEEDKVSDIHNFTDSVKWWGKKLENYYLHPYYPDKNILGFQIIRFLPDCKINDFFKLEFDSNGIEVIKVGKHKYTESDCLEYPEFFKPIYK